MQCLFSYIDPNAIYIEDSNAVSIRSSIIICIGDSNRAVCLSSSNSISISVVFSNRIAVGISIAYSDNSTDLALLLVFLLEYLLRFLF